MKKKQLATEEEHELSGVPERQVQEDLVRDSFEHRKQDQMAFRHILHFAPLLRQDAGEA